MMKGLVVDKVNINQNNQTIYTTLGKPTVVAGMKEITAKAHLEYTDDINMKELIEMNPIKEIETDNYILKDCQITGYDISIGDADGITECSIDFTINSVDEIKEITLKDGTITKVKQSIYSQIEKDYGKPEEMTYDKLKDCLMVEEL